MRQILGTLLCLWTSLSWAATVANVNKSGVALEGYDPVSYFKSDKPLKGSANIQLKQGEVTYWFSSEENKQAFQKEPGKYEPQFGGWCAYAVADSKSKVEVDPMSFLIQDGKLLLFYNGFWGNTREKWLHTPGKDSKTYLKLADANWPEVQSKAP